MCTPLNQGLIRQNDSRITKAERSITNPRLFLARRLLKCLRMNPRFVRTKYLACLLTVMILVQPAVCLSGEAPEGARPAGSGLVPIIEAEGLIARAKECFFDFRYADARRALGGAGQSPVSSVRRHSPREARYAGYTAYQGRSGRTAPRWDAVDRPPTRRPTSKCVIGSNCHSSLRYCLSYLRWPTWRMVAAFIAPVDPR